MRPLAVIPGIAPSLIAVLPLLVLLLLGTITLVFSPAAWWRLGTAALRHPLRSALLLCVGTAFVYGAVRLPAHLPRPAPGEVIAETVEGFPIGDPQAARCRSSGPGPVLSPESISSPAFETLGGMVEGLEVLGKRVLVTRGQEEVACADPRHGEVIWKRELGAPLASRPLGFERLSGSEARRSGVLVVTASRDRRAPGLLSVLDGADGTVSGRSDLPSAPTSHAGIVDDRVLVVLDRSVACYSLSVPGAPRLTWDKPRPAREARGLAGDPSGRFFLLDSEFLLEGDLRDGSVQQVARFEPESPARLAVRDGRAYVLTVGPLEEARVHCIDPSPRGSPAAGAVVWSAEVGRPVGDELCVSTFGVVLTLPGELRVLDPLTGDRLGALPLTSPPLCPAAVGDFSSYLLLEGGRILRYSPALDRLDWSIDLPAPSALPREPRLTAPGALVVAGDRLVASFERTVRVVSEGARVRISPWSHWRGGGDRAGTCDGARMPLVAKVLWRRGFGGGKGEGTDREPSRDDAATGLSVLPLPEGWLVAAPSGGRTLHSWLDDGGSVLAERSDQGHALGAVRSEQRIFSAMGVSDAEGAVLCLAAERQSDRASLRELWRAPTPPLAGDSPIAAGGDLVIVALRSSVLAIFAHDGRRIWESRDYASVRAPLFAGGRIFAPADEAGEGAGLLVALSAADGRLLWKRREPGWRWGPVTLRGEVILAPAESAGRGRIDVLRPGDGSVLRSIPLESEPTKGPLAAVGGQVFFAGRSGGVFLLPEGKAAIRLIDGVPGTREGSLVPPIVGFDLMVLAAGPALRCIDTSTRDAVWEVALPAPPSDTALERGRIVVAAGEEVLCVGAD